MQRLDVTALLSLVNREGLLQTLERNSYMLTAHYASLNVGVRFETPNNPFEYLTFNCREFLYIVFSALRWEKGLSEDEESLFTLIRPFGYDKDSTDTEKLVWLTVAELMWAKLCIMTLSDLKDMIEGSPGTVHFELYYFGIRENETSTHHTCPPIFRPVRNIDELIVGDLTVGEFTGQEYARIVKEMKEKTQEKLETTG